MKKIIQSLFGRELFLRITLPIILVIALVIIGYFSFQKPVTTLTPDQAKVKAENYINKNLMSNGATATIKAVT